MAFLFCAGNAEGAARTPLNVAINYDRLLVVKILIDGGANIQVHLSHTLFEGRKEFINYSLELDMMSHPVIDIIQCVTSSIWNGNVCLQNI